MKRYANYVAEVMCSNCRKRGRIRIPVNTPIDSCPCPRCNLKMLHHPSYFEVAPTNKEMDDDR